MTMRPPHRRAAPAVTTLAAALLLGCEAPPHRDPPVGMSPPGVAAPPVVFDSTRRDLPPAPRESSLLVPPPRPTATRSARGARAARDSAGGGRRRPCLVERVHDGDTVRCKEGYSVRLLLIDAPELSQRPFGGRSQRQLVALVPLGSRVELETDAQARDRYGRLLAYVYASDGRMVNEVMVRAGYAVVLYYSPNKRYLARFEAAAAEARAARRGLYAEGGFSCLPREHRRKRC